MNSRKKTFITIVVTALVTFILTNALYVILALTNSDSMKLEIAKQMILGRYIDPTVTDEALTETAISEMMRSINDKYGRYLTGDEYTNVLSSMTDDHFLGLGIVVVPNEAGSIVVTKTNANTPASLAGISQGDIVLKIDGVDVNADNYTEVISPIRQKKEGEEVVLTIKKKDSSAVLDISLTLARIPVENVLYEMLDSSYGYIRILEFNPGASDAFNTAVDSLLASNVKGLVLDLRNNPGGLVSEVYPITDRILPKGVISTVKDKNGKIIKTYTSDDNCLSLPIMVLVNENTASASEFLTGALVDFGAAKTIGTKTYGKAVGQSLYPIGKDSGLYMTDSKFFLPNGESINGVGIEPDYTIVLPKNTNTYTLPKASDPHIIKALELLRQAA